MSDRVVVRVDLTLTPPEIHTAAQEEAHAVLWRQVADLIEAGRWYRVRFNSHTHQTAPDGLERTVYYAQIEIKEVT